MLDASIVEPVCKEKSEDDDGELSGDEGSTTMGLSGFAYPSWYSTGIDPISNALLILLNEPPK